MKWQDVQWPLSHPYAKGAGGGFGRADDFVSGRIAFSHAHFGLDGVVKQVDILKYNANMAEQVVRYAKPSVSNPAMQKMRLLMKRTCATLFRTLSFRFSVCWLLSKSGILPTDDRLNEKQPV